MSKHTPIPWSVDHNCTSFIIDADGVTVAQVEDDADAEFIVRACNSHDDLLEALKELVKLDDEGEQAFVDMGIQREPEHPSIRKARSAIAKATGASQD